MSSLGKIFDQLNFFAAASVIGTTALTVIFFEKYAKKNCRPLTIRRNKQPLKKFTTVGMRDCSSRNCTGNSRRQKLWMQPTPC